MKKDLELNILRFLCACNNKWITNYIVDLQVTVTYYHERAEINATFGRTNRPNLFSIRPENCIQRSETYACHDVVFLCYATVRQTYIIYTSVSNLFRKRKREFHRESRIKPHISKFLFFFTLSYNLTSVIRILRMKK